MILSYLPCWRAFNGLVEQAKADPESQTKAPSTIKAIYVEGENQLISIIGNIVRNSYNPADIAKRIGKSRSIIVEYNSLLKLPKKIQEKARVDSCIPFRRLKILAADKKKSEPEKIAEYDKLHKKNTAKREQGKETKIKDKPSQTKETRSVAAVRKKLEGMKSALDSVQFGDKVDKDEKNNFMKSLQEIINTAQIALKRLS